jgi:AcrR family transcriptional regulator
VFARDGLEGATTRAISREAGVNEVTLFRQFGTKEHLIEAVVGSEFGKSARSPVERPGGRRGLRADMAEFARAYEEQLQENLPLIRTIIGEIHRHALCQHEALQGIFWPMRTALVERLARAARCGEARAGLNASIAADMFAGAIFSSVLRRAGPGARRDYGASEYRDACVDTFIHGIAAR